jgi:dienelactone hydrolase
MPDQPSPLLLALLLLLFVPACTAGGEVGDDGDGPAGDDDAAGDDDSSPAGVVEEVSLSTSDGLTLAGRWHTAGLNFEGPGVLLLHQYGRDRNDYYQLFEIFEREGISTLAIDFRSHGGSDPASVAQEDLLSDPDQLVHDVRAGLDFLEAQDGVVAGNRIGIMGLSVGANMAVVANHMANGEEDWAVRTTVSLSPRLEAIYSLAGSSELDLGSALYVAADDEQPQADDCVALEAMTGMPTNSQLVSQTTAAHGIELLERSFDVREGSVRWFADWL